MKRNFFIGVVFIAAWSCSAHAINIMAINTEWLWTPYDHNVDGARYNKGDMTVQNYKAELKFYASLVKQHKIQVLAVSEIENESVAINLANAFGSEWRAYFKQGRDTATGQDVAIISNLEPVKGSLTDFGFPRGQLPNSLGKKKRLSKVVGVQFWNDTHQKRTKIGVITSHFLSKRNENKKKFKNRHRQAYALLKAIDLFIEDSDALIVLGDFNDFIDSNVLKTLMIKNQLHSAEMMSFRMQNILPDKKALKRIDHILFRNLNLKRFEIINLKKYSDHDAVFAQFY